ncbi:tRNA threonylcarbamoyladenosine biosynthesis protein TsaB [Kordiimonas lacus]|uniref:tRNA threonylcarbamoyladenosine biosynthesis protein TsaB n=2 Tax=Kordiimonas lacus TaxID=637679 RepID=A0A1G7EB11_9PROT|nr:tRNA threonylcarbamoyladenosine biosynthesis protein TsaB [Kordiimonas lacus]
MTDMTLLAIDTCEGTCSAALVRESETLTSRMERIGRGHAERLLPMIAELMAEAGIGYGDLDRIAVCTGPGTFTGLRIGLSVARGLALTKGLSCVGLMSLPVLAAQAGAGSGAIVHAIVMGRGGQGFYQAYQGTRPDGLPQPISDAECLDGDVIVAKVAAQPGVVVGSGASLVGAESSHDAVDPVVLARLACGLDPSNYTPEPAYLRDADAKKAKALLTVET